MIENVVARFKDVGMVDFNDNLNYSKIFKHKDENGVLRLFEISDNSHFQTTKIIINDEVYNAVEEEEFNIFKLLKEHGLNIDKTLSQSNLINEENIAKYNNFEKKYNEMLMWRKELTSISEGYIDLYESEIKEMITDYYLYLNKILMKFKHFVRISFGAGRGSQIKDLSCIDGIQKYYFVNMKNDEIENQMYFDYIDEKCNGLVKIFEKDYYIKNYYTSEIEIEPLSH